MKNLRMKIVNKIHNFEKSHDGTYDQNIDKSDRSDRNSSSKKDSPEDDDFMAGSGT